MSERKVLIVDAPDPEAASKAALALVRPQVGDKVVETKVGGFSEGRWHRGYTVTLTIKGENE